MNKYIIELIGAFFLVLVIALSGNPIAIGSVLMVMVYMGGPISGGHYNPAVSLGVYVRGKLNLKDFIMYFLFQLIGAILAAVVFYLLMNKTFAPSPGLDVPWWKSFIVELLFTFALVSVVINTATTKKAAGNSYFGLAIGFTVLAGAFAGGPISGGAFNTAVGVGPIIVAAFNGQGSFANLLLYIIAPLLGGILAGLVFKWTNPDEIEQTVQ